MLLVAGKRLPCQTVTNIGHYCTTSLPGLHTAHRLTTLPTTTHCLVTPPSAPSRPRGALSAVTTPVTDFPHSSPALSTIFNSDVQYERIRGLCALSHWFNVKMPRSAHISRFGAWRSTFRFELPRQLHMTEAKGSTAKPCRLIPWVFNVDLKQRLAQSTRGTSRALVCCFRVHIPPLLA
jgi:hypothetical protein